MYLRVCLFDRWCACSSACKLACLLACLLDSRPVEHATATKIQIGSACTKLRPCSLRLSVRLCCGRDKMSKYYPGSKKCYVPPLCVPTETDEDIMFHLLAELDNVATCSSRRNNTKKVTVQPGLDQLQAEPLTNLSRLTGDEPWTSRVVPGASRASSGRGRTRMILVHRARAGRVRGH